jgi:NAD(P)-dependent dehydrogenase (short-subunit alcohol dehydrogenase family)
MTADASTFSLSGKKAIVTGASRGIGKAIAIGLAEAGADVAVASRSREYLAETADRIKALGRRSASVVIDVSLATSCAAGIDDAAGALAGLDILVNNAGIEQACSSLDVDEELWDRILDTNLKGAFFCSQAAAKIMKRKGSGALLNLCSLTSEVGIPTAVPYGSSKSGLLGMTRALAVEWAPLGIRVNAIAPGYYRTGLTEPFFRDDAWQRSMLEKIPLARFGELKDLVGAAVFLCSPASAYVTGVCLPVDGGALASI